MAIKHINLKDFSRELGSHSKEVIQAQKEAVVKGIIKSLGELIANSPIDTGLYAQSWDMVETETSVILGNYAPHAAIIEFGARPFRPPLGPLLAWAKRVLRDPSQPPEYSSDVWGLAIYTQKKIERVGMKPRNVLENQLPLIIKEIERELKRK